MSYYEEFLEKMKLFSSEREFMNDPECYSWFSRNQIFIIRDAAKWKESSKEYKYMITFTIDPKKHSNKNDVQFQEEVEGYIVKLLKDRRRFKTVYYVKEHAETNVHWHAVVYSNTSFKQDLVRYYKNKYGHVDVSRSHEMNDEHTQKYLSKDPTTKIKKIL